MAKPFVLFDFCFIIDPELIYDKAQTGEEGFEGVLDLFPQSFSLKQVQPELSGEFDLKCLVDYCTVKMITN